VDCCIPIGRGQRQLIIGDKNTGKTSIFLLSLLVNNRPNYTNSVDGFGSKRLFNFYISISQSLSKLFLIVSIVHINCETIFYDFIATHSSSNALLSLFIPFCIISICESIINLGIDNFICFDNLSLHSKNARQLNLILGKIPSRNCYSSDIFNIHSTLLERSMKLNDRLFTYSSISTFPIIETVNEDISEFISTNVISITDGQIYLSNDLFKRGIRPAINSGLSISRIGSSAQYFIMKLFSSNFKNTLTNLRSLFNLILSNSQSNDYFIFLTFNYIFYQSHL
jgi:F-type H+-transporting ATPase subunit alpha